MRYCTVVLGSNGRIRPDVVLVNGRPERHSEGSYYLEWREKGRRIRLSVGNDAQDAAARRQRKEAELRALNNGVPILPEPGDGHRSVAAAVADFLEDTELTKKPKTLAAYTTALNYFTESCRKLYLHEIERYNLPKPAERTPGWPCRPSRKSLDPRSKFPPSSRFSSDTQRTRYSDCLPVDRAATRGHGDWRSAYSSASTVPHECPSSVTLSR